MQLDSLVNCTSSPKTSSPIVTEYTWMSKFRSFLWEHRKMTGIHAQAFNLWPECCKIWRLERNPAVWSGCRGDGGAKIRSGILSITGIVDSSDVGPITRRCRMHGTAWRNLSKSSAASARILLYVESFQTTTWTPEKWYHYADHHALLQFDQFDRPWLQWWKFQLISRNSKLEASSSNCMYDLKLHRSC